MKLKRVAAALAALTVVLAACGSDDESGSDNTSAPASSAATPESSAPESSAPDSAAPDTNASGGGESIRLWLNGGDTPDEMVDYAIAEFKKIHPDVDVTFERQQWTGIV